MHGNQKTRTVNTDVFGLIFMMDGQHHYYTNKIKKHIHRNSKFNNKNKTFCSQMWNDGVDDFRSVTVSCQPVVSLLIGKYFQHS